MKYLINFQDLRKLLYRPMSRKEFLVIIGIFVLSTLGLASFLKNFDELHGRIPFYGNGGYGGKKKGGI